MTTFAQATLTQPSRTTNGMKAHAHSGDHCVQLFYAIGAMRGKDVIPLFKAAYAENAELALRIAMWSRDMRGGAGERQLFKNILGWLELNASTNVLFAVLDKIPELGRMDDGFVLKSVEAKAYYFSKIGDYIRQGQLAKQTLACIETMSEEQCQQQIGCI